LWALCLLRDFVLSNCFAASLRKDITGQLFVFLAKKSSTPRRQEAAKNTKKDKNRSYFFCVLCAPFVSLC
jgi:hypothetical protein